MSTPLITVIIPCFNERHHIQHLLEHVLSDPLSKEILVIDGGSTDGTIEVVQRYLLSHTELKLWHNPHKYVSYALNMGIAEAKGEFIARMDAHASYPESYLSTCLKAIRSNACDNVGGYVSFEGKTPTGKAIAAGLSSAWGIGYKINDTFRFDHFTDSVHFGFWPRSTFEKYGLFDTELLRDQDEELNYRIIHKGGRIFKSASIVTALYVRESYAELASQYFQYGFFKPLVIHKVGQIVRFRHLVPSIFLVYLLTIPFSFNEAWPWIIYPILAYFVLGFYFSVNQTAAILNKLQTFFSFPVVHLSYGLGVIFGALNIFFVRPLKKYM